MTARCQSSSGGLTERCCHLTLSTLATQHTDMSLFETGSVYPFKDDSIEGAADTTSDSDTALNLAGEKAG